MKRVYRIDTVFDIDEEIHGIDGDSTVNIFVWGDDGLDDRYGFRAICRTA